MKRNILYLNVKSGINQGKSTGFCRVDQIGNRIKIGVNVNNNILQVDYSQIETTKVRVLCSNGNLYEYEFKINTLLMDVKQNETVVGIEIIYVYKNGIKIVAAGGREIVEKIKQVELEDTVYNVDMECVKEKRKLTTASVDNEPIRIGVTGLSELPREYWHLMKNKFVNCCYGRYGYIGYLKRDGNYIICVPGDISDKECGCARRYGFSTYIESEDESKKGYWLWGGNSSNSNKQ